jgi:hypothetical protein
MDDATLEKNVLAKHPEYSDLPRSQANGQTPGASQISGIGPDPASKIFSIPWFKRQGIKATDALTQDLPAIGGMLGGMAGFSEGGPVGAIGGSGIGGMGGEAGKQIIRRWMGFGDAPKTPEKAASQITGQGLTQSAVEGGGQALPFLAGPMRKTAAAQFERALAPTTKINKAITQDISPEMIQRGIHGSLEGMERQAGQKIAELNPQLNTAYEAASRPPIKTETDTLGVRWASDGTNKVSIPRSVPDESIAQYAQPKLAEQAQIRGNLPWNKSATIQGAGTKVIQDLEALKQTYMPEGIAAQPQAVNAIEGIQGIVKQYGPDISPTSLRRLRQIFEDPVAQRGAYAGADISTNYTLNAQKQAADSIRGILNKNPDIGALNKEISFWLDVQRVTSQSGLRRTGQEGGLMRVLAPLGTGVAGGLGFLAHGAQGSLEAGGAAAVTALAAQIVRSPAYRTMSAVAKDRLASALARGSVGEVSALAARLGIAATGTNTQGGQSNQTAIPQGTQ